MVPQDELALQKILGSKAIPQEVADEYRLRAGMFHRGGASGPIGLMALVDLVRFCGLAPATLDTEPEHVSWGGYPQDGSTRVEARFFGAWKPGAFLGFGKAGSLLVRLEEDGKTRECMRHVVRLVVVESKHEPVHEAPTPLAAQLEAADSDSVSSNGQAAPVEQEKPLPPVGAGDPEAASRPFDADLDWGTVETGAEVYVDIDGDVQEGKFVEEAGGSVSVLLGSGETVTVECAQVTRAG